MRDFCLTDSRLGTMISQVMSSNVATGRYYQEIFAALLESQALAELARRTAGGRRALVLSGLAGSARSLVIAAIEKRLGRRVVFVTRSNREVEETQPDIHF